MRVSDFEVSVSEDIVSVKHIDEGHIYQFEREGGGLSATVTVTPNHESSAFASSFEMDARQAAENALRNRP